jgi:hypothetical protein
MSKQWHYSINGTKSGPVTSQELAELAKTGHLKPSDLIWKEGLKEWKTAVSVKGLFPLNPPELPKSEPPPIPNKDRPPVPVATKAEAEPENTLPDYTTQFSKISPDIWLWVYRGFLALAIIGVVCPWYTYSSRITSSAAGLNTSATLSQSGVSVVWGILPFMAAATGIVLSFILRQWQVHCSVAGAAFAITALVAIHLSTTNPFHDGMDSSFNTQFGSASSSFRSGIDWGLWLTLLTSGAAVGASYLFKQSMGAARGRTVPQV